LTQAIEARGCLQYLKAFFSLPLEAFKFLNAFSFRQPPCLPVTVAFNHAADFVLFFHIFAEVMLDVKRNKERDLASSFPSGSTTPNRRNLLLLLKGMAETFLP
jgi:hypothetical protein